MTVKDMLIDWLSIVKLTLKPHTYRDYLNYANHVIEFIGDIEVSRLTCSDVQQMYFDMLDTYGSTSVSHAHTVFRIAVNYAIDNDFIIKNPLKGVKLPQKQRFVPTFLCSSDLKRLLHTSEEFGIYNAVLLAGCAGLRRGECLALTTADVDRERNIINVSRSAEWKAGRRIITSTKTATSQRLVLVSDKFIQSLFEHSDGEYFCDYSQSVLCRRLDSCCKAAEVPHIRFHDLRHTFASISVVNGDNLKVIQSRLGHSSIQLTLDTYAHLDVSAQERSATLFDDII